VGHVTPSISRFSLLVLNVNVLTPSQVQRLAAYLPATLVRRILADGLPTPGQPHALWAAALFSDISGFTAMSEELASDGLRGAEEVNRVLLTTFTAMIDVIHSLGGAVSHFYGDAMSAYFPDEDGRGAQRALLCAQQMQRLMEVSFARVVTNRPPGKEPTFALTMKIGLGYGRCQELVVGNVADSLEFVLTGEAVDEAAAAEKQAAAGQIVLGPMFGRQVGLPAERPYGVYVQREMMPVPAAPVLQWQEYDQDETAVQRLVAVAPLFMHPALANRLLMMGSESLAEHRPVTSMFVQFAFVGDDDDASTIETVRMGQQLQAYYEWACGVVGRFGQNNARVNRVLTGDKGNQLHIMFGAPVAPDAPEQAMRCALALQAEKPPFIAYQRVGLAVGKVFAGPVGAAARQEYTVVGDVVNLSARLMQVCAPGEVLTDQATAERAQQWLVFEALPPMQVKGKQTQIVPQRPLGEQALVSRMQSFVGRWERPLVGRDTELAQLVVWMEEVRGGYGRLVALQGQTGVGKSRLLAAAVQYWLEQGGQGALGVCYQHTQEMPYSAWRGVWQELFGLVNTMPVAEQVARVVRRTRRWAPHHEADCGLWAEVLGLPLPQSAELAAMSGEVRQARLFAMSRRCLEAIARQRPLLLIIEGAQWADQASLVWLNDVRMQMADLPLLLCVALRPDSEALVQQVQEWGVVIELADLPPTAARALMQELVGLSSLPESIEQHIGLHDRDGQGSPVNPLFLEEALRMLESVGVLQRNGRMQVNEQRFAQIQVPDTIYGLLLARLDRLPAAERDLVQVASVIGRQFAAEPLAALSAEPSSQIVIEMLHGLSDTEITRLVTPAPEWLYLFQHAMTHEVAYESLPYARRQMLHALVADWLVEQNEANLKPLYSLLAFHFSRAGNAVRGLEFALKAADEARAIFANQEAIDLYTQAEGHLQVLGMVANWRTAVHLYLSRAEALRFTGDFARAIADAEQAYQLAAIQQELEQLADACNLLAELKCRQSRFDEAQELAGRVLGEWATAVSAEQIIRAHHWTGFAFAVKGEYDVALHHFAQAERLCLETDNNDRLASLLEMVAFVYYSQKQLEEALAAMQRSIKLSRHISIPTRLASSLSNVALVQLQLGRAQEALQVIDEAIDLARDTSRNFLAQFIGNKAEILAYLGRLADAKRHLDEAGALLARMDDPLSLVEVHLIKARNYFAARHEWAEAAYWYAQAEAILAAQPEPDFEMMVRQKIGQAEVKLAQGEAEVALAFVQGAAALIDAGGYAWWGPAVAYVSGRAYVALQQWEQAAAVYADGLQQCAADGCPDFAPLLLLALAEMTEDEAVRRQYYLDCMAASERRAWMLDKIYCLARVGQRMQGEDDEELRLQGAAWRRQAVRLWEELEKKEQVAGLLHHEFGF
jgi:class 3 adenylate cyclase/tetratricopeptide (TPR) repeat protein